MGYGQARDERHAARDNLAREAKALYELAQGDARDAEVLRAAWALAFTARRFSDAVDLVEVEKVLGRERARKRLGFLS